uniref:Uncharacterized protein n=1 Tax=mine drainage metagenome TaxID=410659 RepID=E6PSQ5_9ZZZZ
MAVAAVHGSTVDGKPDHGGAGRGCSKRWHRTKGDGPHKFPITARRAAPGQVADDLQLFRNPQPSLFPQSKPYLHVPDADLPAIRTSCKPSADRPGVERKAGVFQQGGWQRPPAASGKLNSHHPASMVF